MSPKKKREYVYLEDTRDQPLRATITSVERKQANEIFINRAGEYVAKYGEPTDLYLVISGTIAGVRDEPIRLGQLKLPEGHIVSPMSNLARFVKKYGIVPREGMEIEVSMSDRGFWRVAV